MQFSNTLSCIYEGIYVQSDVMSKREQNIQSKREWIIIWTVVYHKVKSLYYTFAEEILGTKSGI